jgi:hypothetical protein
MRGGSDVAISVIVEGDDAPARLAGLARRVADVHLIAGAEGASSDSSTLNPLVDAAPSNWILIVRRGETVPDNLAEEIEQNTRAEPRAWGYRLAVRRLYCGKTMPSERGVAGEVRLFHRRKARMQPGGRMKVQGTVVRLRSALDLVLHDSEEAHIAALRQEGRVESTGITKVLGWVALVLRNAPRSLHGPYMRYLWVESGWQRRQS